MARFTSALVGATLAVVVLSACAGAGTAELDAEAHESPTARPTTEFTPTPRPTPTTSPILAESESESPLAEYVSADTSALTIGPIDCSRPVSFDYFTADVDEVTAALSLAFGFEASVAGSVTPGQSQSFDWHGFQLHTAHLPGDYPEGPGFYVWVTTPSVNGVPALIGGSPGVGGNLADLGDAVVDDTVWGAASTSGFAETFPVYVPLEQISDPPTGQNLPPLYNATLVWFSNPGQVITQWTAPERRY